MKQIILNGVLLDEDSELSLNDLCCACSSPAEWVIELVEEGAIEPVNLTTDNEKFNRTQQTKWRFSATSLHKARTAIRLQRDLNINLSGVALALDLLDKIESLEARIRRLELLDKS